jgi:hypothetical protein
MHRIPQDPELWKLERLEDFIDQRKKQELPGDAGSPRSRRFELFTHSTRISADLSAGPALSIS